MAEALSPKPNKPRAPFASPTSPFFLGSNDDKLERAQARAARAAISRRKSFVPTSSYPPNGSASNSVLDKKHILELFQNCIKLASENKINQKNTWDLSLIDHLNDIIKVEEENDTETNFQKASCTLEAGVKIYSMRVDSVHSEAYKVLGGINRVGQENEQDDATASGGGQEDHDPKNAKEKKWSPLSTLESSFESLNLKKFDVAFAVDPLYHQTSAQFDEGGAKGLLLNNLGVYDRCRVLFDSMEVPGKCIPSLSQQDRAEIVDISFARECIEQMVVNMPEKDHISPSLANIVNQFDEDSKRSETYCYDQKSSEQVYETFDSNFGPDGNEYEDFGTCAVDQDDQTSVVDEGINGGDPIFQDQQEDEEPYSSHYADMDHGFGKIEGYLFLSLGFSSKQNAWAGPGHWKYRKVIKDPEDPAGENGSPVKAKKARNRKSESDIDFTKDLESDMSHIFAPPKNSKSIFLPSNKAPCNTKLPEDCHYQPEDLVKLFLLPTVMCLGRRERKYTDYPTQGDGYGAVPSLDDEDGYYGTFDDGNAQSDVEDSDILVSQPRQVNKIEVQYDKTSKQVDVQVLKTTLWDHVQEINQSSIEGMKVSFQQALSSFPSDCRAAASLTDISPHLCFICLLHLANEHELWIEGSANLDDLTIHLQT